METIEKLSAEYEIRNLISSYSHHADDDEAYEWARLFAPDGALVIGDRRVVGHAALEQWLTDAQADVKMRHLHMNVAVVVESSKNASATLDILLMKSLEMPGGTQWLPFGTPRYNDRFTVFEGEWRFAERILEMR